MFNKVMTGKREKGDGDDPGVDVEWSNHDDVDVEQGDDNFEDVEEGEGGEYGDEENGDNGILMKNRMKWMMRMMIKMTVTMIMMTVMTRTNLGTSLLPARSLAVGLLVLVAVDFFTGVLLNVGTLDGHHCVNRRC